jgi:hypothetical protein
LKNRIWPVLFLLTSCFGGGDRGSDTPLAKVNNSYFYESELKGIVPPGTSARDSITIIRSYINNWVTQELILDKARKNLLSEDMEFDKQLEDYRNSLIIYAYESKLIKQNLDTVIGQKEIEEYYTNNIGNFQLKNNIVKVFYARINSDDPSIKTIRKFFHSDLPKHRDSLEARFEAHADLFFLNDETWVLFDDVLKFVPIKTYNIEAFLQNNRKIEIADDPYIYFVKFSDFRVKDGVSPLSFEKENIRRIIINKRKLKLISDMKEEVFQTALEKNDFEIY